MEFNTILFRPPPPSYTFTRFDKELIWIPGKSLIPIPCLYLPCNHSCAKTFLYFHANAEDLGKVYDFLDIMRCVLEVNVFAPEYPGYGLYKGKANCKNVLLDGQIVYSFLQQQLQIPAKDIVVVGRSIGTGPAAYIASQNSRALVLISPYTSIRNLVKNLIGKFLQYLVKDQFKNIEVIKKVTCPILLIHGKKDALIPYAHSEALYKECNGNASIFLSDSMSHNKFEFYEDVLSPIDVFLKENNVYDEVSNFISIPSEFFIVPSFIKDQLDLLRDFL